MKKILFFAFIAAAAFFTSCSDDNVVTTVNNEPSQLKRIETLLGANDAVIPGQIVALKRIQHYEQGEIVGDTIFDFNGNYYFYTLRTVSGNTNATVTYKADGTVWSTDTKTYDGNGRLTFAEFTEEDLYRKTTVTYGANGHATTDIITNVANEPSEINYEMNTDGLINKMLYSGGVHEITFISGKPVTYVGSSPNFQIQHNYTYYPVPAGVSLLSATAFNNRIIETGNPANAVMEIPFLKGWNNQTVFEKTFDNQGRITSSKVMNDGFQVFYYYE